MYISIIYIVYCIETLCVTVHCHTFILPSDDCFLEFNSKKLKVNWLPIFFLFNVFCKGFVNETNEK